MILVDTSAWVEFFRGRDPYAALVDSLLATNEVALCGPVLTEIRRGLRSTADRKRVLPLLDACTTLPTPAALWQEAGDLGFVLARKGVTVKSMDLLIATHALAHAAPLLTRDADFRAMRAAGIDLVLIEP